jgi:hypothetical protein
MKFREMSVRCDVTDYPPTLSFLSHFTDMIPALLALLQGRVLSDVFADHRIHR